MIVFSPNSDAGPDLNFFSSILGGDLGSFFGGINPKISERKNPGWNAKEKTWRNWISVGLRLTFQESHAIILEHYGNWPAVSVT